MAATARIDFQAIFDSVPTPLMIMCADHTIIDMNEAYLATVGRERDKIVGRDLFDAFPANGQATTALKASIGRVRETASSDFVPVIEYPVATRDQGVADGMRYWSATHVPILNDDGDVDYILQHTQDVTEFYRQKGNLESSPSRIAMGGAVLDRAERVQALNASLLAESTQLRGLFMRSPSFMCVLRGPEYRYEMANTAYQTLVGRENLVGRTVRDVLPELEGQVYLALLDKVYKSGEAFVGKQMRAEFIRSPETGPEEAFVDFVYQPIFDEAGLVAGIFVDGNDVTDHVKAERSQELLVRELHHRVRNTLATVQGVMNSTARTAETIEDYQWAFSGRISSLARTHSLLTEEINQFVSFPSLLRQEVGIYADGFADRVVLEGPDIELPSQLAVPLGMTIHELSTNAFRHGALSVPGGRVTVTWMVVPGKDKRILVCRWIESGGPPVSPPERKGFGSMILTRVLAQQIGAKIDASYLREGFELTADIPLDIERE